MGTYSMPLVVSQLNRHRTSWANDDKAGQGAYGTKYPQEFVGAIGFSIGSFDNIKYKITGIQMQVTRTDGTGYYNRSIEFHLYMGYIDPNNLRSAPSNYSKQKISVKTLNSVSSGATNINFTSADLLKFNTYCLDAENYYFMIFAGDGEASSSTSYTNNYTLIEEIGITLIYEDRASDGTAKKAELGSINSIKFNPLSGFQYKAKWSLGTKEYISTAFTQNSPISYTIPENWGEEFPTSFSKQGTVSLITYDLRGNEINKSDYEITYQCPSENSGPVSNGFTHTCAQKYYNKSGSEVFLASLSKFEYIFSGSGQYGAAVTATLSIKNQNNDTILKSATSSAGQSTTATISNYVFNTPGTYIITKTIKDSRGQSITLPSSTYTIVKGPNFTSTPQIIKIDDEGNEDVQGLYLKVVGTLNNSSDTVLATSTWFDTNETKKNCTLTANTTNSYINTSQKMFEIDIAASVVIKIKSSLYFTNSGASSNLVYSLPAIRTSSANYLLHFKEGGQAIGIGSAAEYDRAITMGWPVYFNDSISLNKPLGPEYGGTGASSKTGALENLGALPVVGGTITGNLTIGKTEDSKGLYVYNRIGIYEGTDSTTNKASSNGRAIYFYNEAGSNAFKKNNENTYTNMIRTIPINSSGERQNRFCFYEYSPVLNNINQSTGFSEAYLLPPVTHGLTTTKQYNILTTKDYPTTSDFYIMKDQIIQIQGICCVGFQKQVNSTQTFFFSIPIGKRFHDEVSSCRITGASARFLGGTSYIFNSDAYYNLMDYIQNQTISLDKISNTLKVSLNFTYSLSGFKNNTVFCADIASMTIQFE